MSAPQAVLDLIEHFERELEAFKSGQYNEAQLRLQFLDPFFKALGWDLYNENKYAEAYKDVIHEDSLRIGTGVKAPDYCFRIGGARKFFLEAKKPSVFIKEEIPPVYQLRRYAWTAKLPLSILSDFEEFAIYDCRIRPFKNDKASTARIFYCTFRELAEKWDYIAGIFSRDSVLKGSFDRYAAENKTKRGTAEVDAEFLDEIERWRKGLAENLALRNQKLTQRELNFSVQRIIDRIIFLRIAEDRGLEDYGRLAALANGPRIYRRLCEQFEAADARYNSGLFHFKKEAGRHEAPDELTLDLDIDDKLLKDILKNLYYPDSPYAFSVLSADILGQVYEQFLGKVITLTAGHHAKVDDKPEVKKAGGVYYTPTYIVDYIVRETVGKLVEGKTPKQVQKLRILDPACGSGSFLIGAYQFLLDWHLDFYTQNEPEKWAKGKKSALHSTGGGWKLTIDERKRILLNNIYGVDIDAQAVEVTKLSLLLKVLEGETEQTLQPTFRIFHERALPDLGDNIKCGNSLIGPDFYQQDELPLLTDEERYRINVFDWRAEFPEIFKAGGFDAVIGNPPYRMLQPHNTGESELRYLRANYCVAEFKMELFHMFLQRGITLLKSRGFNGYIVPTTLLNNVYAEGLRRWMASHTSIEIIAISRERIFADADVQTSVVLFRREGDDQVRANHHIQTTTALSKDVSKLALNLSVVAQRRFETLPGHIWNVLINERNASLIDRLRTEFRELSSVATINRGLITGDRDRYFSEKKLSSNYVPIITGSDVQRYSVLSPSEYVLFERPAKAGGCWDKEVHLAPTKIVVRQIGVKPTASYLDRPIAVTGNVFTVRAADRSEELYLLGLINSRLVEFFWWVMFTDFKSSFPQVTIFSLAQLPIRWPPLEGTDKPRHDRMVHLVERILDLHRQRAAARTPQEQTSLDRQIQSTDTQIDRLVYELYGLTEDEIRIVEGEKQADEARSDGSAAVTKPAKLPQGKSTPQSEADAAHFYSFNEDPVAYRTDAEQKGD